MSAFKKTLVVALAVISAVAGTAPRAAANADVYDKVIPSVGLVLVHRSDNKTHFGTCWVVDQERRLVITSNHVVGDANEAGVWFPRFANGDVVPLRDAHLKSGTKIVGQVVHRDVNRDLALIRLARLPSTAAALPLARRSPRPGDTVHAIGNSGYNHGILWRYTRGQVRCVVHYTIKIETGTIKAVVVETQGPINHGDSGGPVVNERGELVGVTAAYDTKERLVTWNIDVREVRAFLANARANENSLAAFP